jgi:trehalose 6-phosphate phosphatase
VSIDPLPPFERTALLLDFDGTLVDIAPHPDAVTVPPGLVDDLRRLRDRLDGALAIVTGRPIEAIDAFLGDSSWAVAGEHGAAFRHGPDNDMERPHLPAAPCEWVKEAARLADRYPGSLLERKARGFVLHFRTAPEAGPAFHAALTDLLSGQEAFELLPGLMMWEVRPRGADKGAAVRGLMQRPPFRERLPLFIGDDVTDEDGMAAARAMGGSGLRVDRAFGTPADVRAWLQLAAATGDWPPLVGGSR